METKTWNIDLTHSSVNFAVRHMVFAKVRGHFAKFSGTLVGEELESSTLSAEIEAESIDTGVADRDKHLRSADFFDAAAFPKLAFKSTRIEKQSGTQYKAHGDLTIHGVTKPVVLDLDFHGQAKDPWGNDRLAFTLEGAVDRTDFGLRYNQVLETGGVLVGERVEIEIEVQVVKAAAALAA